MLQALKLAQQAFEEGEVPVGAVVVHADKVIGKGYNQREKLSDPTAHAEMLAITAAAEAMGSWRLEGCTLYVTLEPCLMCAGAMILSRLDRLVFGAADPKAGAVGSLYNVLQDERLNHRVDVVGDVMGQVCGGLLSDFFRQQRQLGKK